MPYQSDSIATVINRLNVQYFLPAIQREFVWKPDQIVQLFDSIMRGYPISSFLFWELRPENRDKWDAYRFIENFHQGGTHNQIAGTEGVQQLTLVLDGQQRLTSFLIGLRGSYTIKLPYKRWENPDAWVKQHLYLDLLQDAMVDGEHEIDTRYGFSFSQEQPAPDSEHYWFRVGKILNFDNANRFEQFIDEEEEKLPETIGRGKVRVFRHNLRTLRRVIWEESAISYYIEHDQDYDRVLDIFVRANEGGTKLSKSDLLLSMVTARWGDMNAREEIYSFVEHINKQLTRKNDLDKDFVMKACLVLSDLPVQYLVKNFNNQNLSLIHEKWEEIKRALRAGIDLANAFGIDRDTLTSANALIPVLYWLFKHPTATLRGTSTFDVRNASLIRRWLLMALLNSVFSGTSDNALRDARRAMQEHALEPDFPAAAINEALLRTGRSARFDEHAVENFLNLTYTGQSSFLGLSLLYDDNSWGTMTYHKDHIFPQKLFTQRSLDSFGLDLPTQQRYRALMNRIGNLELLLSYENEVKSGQDFAAWITTRDQSFKQRHLIPEDPSLYRLDRFEDFVAAREDLIRRRLAQVFAPVPARSE